MSSQPKIILAPLRGITDYIFRNILWQHFGGFDCAIAPFITPQNNSEFPDKTLKDVLPANNQGITLIPQLLHNSEGPFLILARRLNELGYHHFNWNLGCPAPQVAKKGKGSGMLPHPDKISGFLEHVLPELSRMGCELSIKIRLGYQSKEEIFALLPLLNDFQIKEITVHTRLGNQLYKGHTDEEAFAYCLELSRHPLIYNGDIANTSDYLRLLSRYPEATGWMIGRGAIARPFLAEEIKGIATGDLFTRIKNFHDELFLCYSKTFCGDSHITGRMKLIWIHLIESFPGTGKKALKKILKSSNREKYLSAVDELFTGFTSP